MSLKHLSLAGLAGLASGNFVSPGLGKCMIVGPSDEEDSSKQDAILVSCEASIEQHFAIRADGSIGRDDLCMQADAAMAESKVHFVPCDQSDLQHWQLTENGYVKLYGSEQCLDVTALQNADGTWETWDEIKLHDSVHLQVYDCHDVCTKRVNQLWAWAPIGDSFGTAELQTSGSGATAGNFVSPGLEKCLVVGSGQTADALASADNIKVQLTTCNDAFNQDFAFEDGQIIIPQLEKCLVPETAKANSKLVLGECSGASTWMMGPEGYMRLQQKDSTGTELCLDVQAGLKADGSREKMDEIKAHNVVDVHLYDCHDLSTERVNQLWGWSPITPITPDTVGTRSACKAAPTAQGSMPADVGAADALVGGDLASGLLSNYVAGSMDISSAVTLPVVAAASLLLIATSAVILLKRNRFSSDAELLLAPEE